MGQVLVGWDMQGLISKYWGLIWLDCSRLESWNEEIKLEDGKEVGSIRGIVLMRLR